MKEDCSTLLLRNELNNDMRVLLLAACFLATAHGHGHMTWPPSTRHGGSIRVGADCANGACYWFSNNVEVSTGSTLPTSMRSVEPEVTGGKYDVFSTSPWRSPGKAPVYGSGCGVAGGHPTDAYANGGQPPKNVAQGFDGAKLAPVASTLGPARWVRGGTAEIAWAVSANHAGGYAYRLCRADEPGGVTEACFQRGHLRFATDDNGKNSSYVVYPNATRVALPRDVTNVGTHPAGSQWARFGVPSCRECDRAYDKCGAPLTPVSGLDYGTPWNKQVNCYAECTGSVSSKASGSCPGKTQFSEKAPGYSGFGKKIWEWSVLDRVEVPADLAPGKYVLSWRWDCEESTQVWQNCADVTVVAEGETGEWDVASAAAIAKVPAPPPPAPAKDPSSKTTADSGDACAKHVAYCEGEGKGKNLPEKCGATEKETRAICEKLNAASQKKNNQKTTSTTVSSAAAPPLSIVATSSQFFFTVFCAVLLVVVVMEEEVVF